jgi:predicted transcriptional regulator
MSNDATITLRLPRDIVERLNELAAEDEINRSLLIRRLLLSGIYQRQPLV